MNLERIFAKYILVLNKALISTIYKELLQRQGPEFEPQHLKNKQTKKTTTIK